MIIVLARLSFDDVFEDLQSGKFYSVKGFESGMVEVKEAGVKRFWAWPSQAKVKINKETWESINRLLTNQQ